MPYLFYALKKGKAIKKYAGFIKNTMLNQSLPAQKQGNKVMVVPGEENGDCTYLMTWDWYQDCYYPTPESTTPTYCDPVVIYNVDYILLHCIPPPGGGSPPLPEPECLGVLNLETGECIVEPVTPCDFVREAAKNPRFKQRVDALTANVTGNTEKVYAINYTTGIPYYAEGAVGVHNVSVGIGAKIDFYGHNHFGTGLAIFSADDMEVLYKLDSANLINNYNSFSFFVATSYGQYVLSIENKTQFQSFLGNFANTTSFNAWVSAYNSLVSDNVSLYGKSNNEAQELAFLEKIASQGIKLFKKDNSGIFKPIKKSTTSQSIVNAPCDEIE